MKFLESFAGKNVLVTGATGAIGSNVCGTLIKAGVGKLVMFIKDRARLDPRIDSACKSTYGVSNYHVDVVDLREPLRIEQKFTNAIKQHFEGKIDALILCHGTIVDKGIVGPTSATIPEYDEIMNVNVRATMHLVSMTVPFMKQQNCGTISILSSS